MEAPRLQRTPSMEQREIFKEYDSRVFNTKPKVIETGQLDAALLKRKRQNQKKRFSTPKKIKVTVEHYHPAKIMGQRRPGITRRGGKRKRHKTRKRKRKRKRRKHFKGGFGEKPGVGIKEGQTVRIKTENSTDDTKTWDPCWKVIVKTPRMRGAIVKKGMEEKVVNDTKIKPQGFLSKRKCQNISGGKRRKTHRRKKHKRRRKRKTYKK